MQQDLLAPANAEPSNLQTPLAERVRPQSLGDVAGQEHLLGPQGPVGRMTSQGRLSSMILWGPPGVGKTTIARLLAEAAGLHLVSLSAVHSGTADLRRVFDEARIRRQTATRGTLLFVDEIHRFSKAQADALLPAVEDGTVVLVGATTENPSFALPSALLSRARVQVLRRLDDDALELILQRAEAATGRPLPLTHEARSALRAMADGDGRFLLGLAEELLALPTAQKDLDQEALAGFLQRRAPLHDKGGDGLYDVLSAFHKSCRGSDPDAALYWAARLLEAGEPVETLFRRLSAVASEDVGLADPQAMVQVISAWQTFDRIGLPEGQLPLAQAIIYVATAPKSSGAHDAILAARESARKTGSLPPPLFARNAPTKLMRELGYKQGYVWDHETPNGYAGQNFFPENLPRQNFYQPVERGFERELQKRIAWLTRFRQGKADPP